jgi:hypothetical protein
MCWHLSVSLPWWAVVLLFGDSRFPFPRLPAPVRGVARRSGISLTRDATPGPGCAHAKAPRLAIRGHFDCRTCRLLHAVSAVQQRGD